MTAKPPLPVNPPQAPSRSWAWVTTLVSGAVTVLEFLDSAQVLPIISANFGTYGPKIAATITAVAGLVTVWASTKHTDHAAAKAAQA